MYPELYILLVPYPSLLSTASDINVAEIEAFFFYLTLTLFMKPGFTIFIAFLKIH